MTHSPDEVAARPARCTDHANPAGREACGWLTTLAALTFALHALPVAAQAQARPDDWVYTIERGDTLLGIKARLLRPDADWRVLQKLNRIADARRLKPSSTLRIPLPMLREVAAQAEVLHAHGEVWLERPGSERQALQAALALRGGDSVVTGKQSSASVRFADGSRTLLGPDSRLLLERLSTFSGGGVESRVRLDAGSANTRVPETGPAKRFQMRTPSANLGVRGTEFRGRVDGARTLAEVLKGRVAVGPQPVDSGFGVVAGLAGVSLPRPLTPAPNLADLPERVERLPLQLPVGRVTGLGRYRAQVFAAEAPDVLLLDSVFEQSHAQWPVDLSDGRYELQVRASDADGIEGLDARKSFTLKARPEPPFLLRPRAGEQWLDEDVLLAWSRNPDAASYRLQVAPTADFSAPLLERSGITATELRLSLPLGVQHWRVAAVRVDGDMGPWGDGQSFVRVARPPAPAPTPAPATPLTQPPKSSAEGLVLSWSQSPLAGASYQVQVAQDAAFTQLVLDLKTQRTEQLLPQLAPGSYHVRVRTFTADGRASAYGATQLVDIARSLWWLWLLPLVFLL